MILRNLREAGFAGSIGLVNPKYPEIEGIRAVKTIAELPAVPDLIIVAAPPPTVPEIVATAAAKGAPTAIIITAGLGHGPGSLAEAARAGGARTGPAARSDPIASESWSRAPGSTPASPAARRAPAISR